MKPQKVNQVSVDYFVHGMTFFDSHLIIGIVTYMNYIISGAVDDPHLVSERFNNKSRNTQEITPYFTYWPFLAE